MDVVLVGADWVGEGPLVQVGGRGHVIEATVPEGGASRADGASRDGGGEPCGTGEKRGDLHCEGGRE